MLKVFGAIFILCSTTWIGFEIARMLSQRSKQLRQFKSALQALEAEIMFGQTPLDEAALRLSEQLKNPISLFFKKFAVKLTSNEKNVKEAWIESLKEVWGYTSLKKSEFEILAQFGENLGRHDRMTEQKQIMLTLTHLEREESDARDRQYKYERMVKSLGFLCGLLIVILLM
jgi:stage III sporulation protein AB